MLVDRRTGHRVSELAGPGAPEVARLALPIGPVRPGAAWAPVGQAWDSRAMCWRAEWHHASYPLRVRDFEGYVAGTLNSRHWKTAPTPAALLDLFFPIG